MADSRIKLTIESLFKGEGFTKANQAVKGLSKNVKDASSAIGGLSGALGGMTGPIGKVAGGIEKLSTLFKGAGWVGIAITVITSFVSLFNKWKEKQEEAAKAHKELMDKMEDGYKKRLASAIERARAKQVAFFDAIINKGNEAISVMNKLYAAQRQSAAVKRDNEHAQHALDTAMIDLDVVNRSRGQSKEDQAVIAAEGEVKKAEIRGEEKLRDAHNEVTAVLKDMENTANQIDELEKVVEAMAKNGKDVTAKEADLVMLRTKLQDSNTALDTARKKVAEIETKNATDKQKAEQALYDAQVAQMKAEADERAKQNKALFDAKKKIADDEKKASLENQKKKLEAEKINIKEQGNKMLDSLKKRDEHFKQTQAKGMASDAAHKDGLFGQYQYQLDENGNIKNFRDWQRAQRYAARADRDGNRNDPAAQQYNRLQRRQLKGGKLSQRDQQFMKDFEDFEAAKNAPLKIQELVTKMEKKVEDIDKKLKDLGAK